VVNFRIAVVAFFFVGKKKISLANLFPPCCEHSALIQHASYRDYPFFHWYSHRLEGLGHQLCPPLVIALERIRCWLIPNVRRREGHS